MNSKEKIGGRAYSNGIKLMGSKYSVKAYYDKTGTLKYKKQSVNQNKYIKMVRKIPILRGIVLLLWTIGLFIKESVNNPKKYWFILLIILADVGIMYGNTATTGRTNDLIWLIYYLVPVILILIFWKTIKEILKYHGAEHKAVNYYENGCQGEIDSYSRLHRRCGSNIVFYYFIISIVFGLLNISFNFFVDELLCLGLAYEAIRNTPDRILFLPQIFQRFVTREPDSKHLKAAQIALNNLIN